MTVILAAERFVGRPKGGQCRYGLDGHRNADLIRQIILAASEDYPAAKAAITADADGDCLHVEIYYSQRRLSQMGYGSHPSSGHVDIDGYHYQLSFVSDDPGAAA